jgi:hypothetical protein
VAVRTANITLFNFNLDSLPGVPPFYHPRDGTPFGGAVTVVELKHYGVGLAAVDARVVLQVVKDFLGLSSFSRLLKSLNFSR